MTRREEILVVARAQIAERGYGGTSMRDIAEANGLLAGSLYSHFRSKAEIVRDIVVRFYDELLPAQTAVLDSGGTGADRFGAMVGVVYGVCSRHREELTILHYDWHTLSRLDALSHVHHQSLRTLELWSEVIEAGKADGSIRATVDSEAMVRIATSSIHALIDTVRYASHPVDATGTPEAAALLQEVLLTGVGTAEASAVPGGRRAKSNRRSVVATSRGN